MAYVTVPKDLTKVKTKVLFGLTRRQLLCFGAAAATGLPLFFLMKRAVNTSTATLCMILLMLPFFLFAMYERHGQPLEVMLKHLIQTVFVRPKQRPYRTNNYYAVLMRQRKLEREVKRIVQPSAPNNGRGSKYKTKTKAHQP